MDFELSDEQQALARSVAALCARRFPLESVRAAEGVPSRATFAPPPKRRGNSMGAGGASVHF